MRSGTICSSVLRPHQKKATDPIEFTPYRRGTGSGPTPEQIKMHLERDDVKRYIERGKKNKRKKK